MEKANKIKKRKKTYISKKKLSDYISAEVDKLSWKMGEKKFNYRERLHDR